MARQEAVATRGQNRLLMQLLKIVILIAAVLAASNAWSADCVILLHGLARTSNSMIPLENALGKQGYKVANIDYESRKKTIEELSSVAIGNALEECHAAPGEKIHFITHSMGGILVRYYLYHNKLTALGRVVMIAPPNKGSEVVDYLGRLSAFRTVNGPAGEELGTGPDSLPSRLGPVDYSVGIIAGTATVNPILSLYLPNPDDGKVSVASTKVAGMTDFVTVPASHTFIMRNKTAIKQAIAFIKTGTFIHDTP